MKKIKYALLQSILTDEDGDETITVLEVEMPWSEDAESIAIQEAYNGQYEIYDDGMEAAVQEMTPEERIAALEAKLAALTGE